MPERGAHMSTVVDRPGKLAGAAARVTCVIFDPFTVLR
jgi:hypothetical protein